MSSKGRSLLLGLLLAVGVAGCGADSREAGPVAPNSTEIHDKPDARPERPGRGAHGNSDD